MAYHIEFTEEALAMLGAIPDSRIRGKILDRIRKLADEPTLQGKPLTGALAGCRSIRAVGQRYRIIYLVQERFVRVLVVGVGIRKAGDREDIYSRLHKGRVKSSGGE